MFRILALLFILIPALEIYILFKFGSAFGAFNTFLIVVVTGIVGAALAKSEGLIVINKIQTELGQNKLPAKDMIQGLIIFAGGILLLTPGFFTDIFGLTMILPGTRLMYIGLFKGLFEKGMKSGNVKFYSFNNSAHQNTNFNEHESVKNDENIIEADFTKK